MALLLAAAVVCPAQVTFTEYPVPTGSFPRGITTGPDGNLWFTESEVDKIGKITTAGVITEFSGAGERVPLPESIVAGSDGNLWFTKYFGGKIGRITTAGVITEFLVPGGRPYAITAGPDGNLWFTERLGYNIGRITPAGVITEFPIPTPNSEPAFITVGPDGNLWFTEYGANTIAKITTAGVITEFALPTANFICRSSGGPCPEGITAGPDGNLWFVEAGVNKIGKITTTGAVTEYPIPTANSNPFTITAGTDGNLWFTEVGANNIGRITPAGVVTEYPIPTPASHPYAITTGPDGNLWFTEQLGNKVVKANIPSSPPSIHPAAGGNAGSVTVQISGFGFKSGATVTLTGVGPDIPGINTTVVSGFFLTTTFDLTGATPGTRTVVVTNPDHTTVTLPDAFNIEEGGAADVKIRKIGSPAVPGRDTTYFITLSNTGIIDSGQVLVMELVEPWFTFLSSSPNPTTMRQSPDMFPPSAMGTNYNALPDWVLPNIPPGSSRMLTYSVGLDPSFPIGQPVKGTACIMASEEAMHQFHLFEVLCYTASAASCALIGPACIAGIHACTLTGLAVLNYEIYCHDYQQLTRGSRDPNDLIGPPGSGPQRWLLGEQPMQYAILFENLPTATKSATNITLTDQFDATTLDLTTITVGPITFGSWVYTPPNVALAITPFTADVDLRPVQNLIVRINATLNVGTGVLSVNFISIDPTTGLPPTDVLAGFLLPGIGGSVVVNVKAKTSLAMGTVINDRASIVFDTNAPILTPEWSNTIDNTDPTSLVTSLPAQSPSTFPVQWAGSDVGSGVQDFTVYTSDNGGLFVPWLSQTTLTQASYSGVSGHTYSFYSLAKDRVGNAESPKSTAEATTNVVAADSTPPVITANISGTQGMNGWYRSAVAVSWSVTDSESGISSSTGCASRILTNDTAGTTVKCSARNGAGLQKSASVTVKIDKAAPVLSGLPTTSGCGLWPPNHQLVTVGTFKAADNLSKLAFFNVTGTSNEPENGLGDGDKAPDIMIGADIITNQGKLRSHTVKLRAERSAKGKGRTYTLKGAAADQAGNTAPFTRTCLVPRDK